METKKCSRCHQPKPLSDFTKDVHQKSGLDCRCRQCNKEVRAACYIKYTPERLAYARNYYQAHKEGKVEVLTHYGGRKCACVQCGFLDIRALTIDHVGGRGTEHRKSLHTSHFYIWLRKNNYPEGYQTLCMNCQFIKRQENRECANKQFLTSASA